ncbi:protein phosphatase CheZ [Cohaesibacter haloalkalitolerans]|uniref:protein phosphatase CheZ n=1 Tax=Cohaesibacter haloalkalitolerans TaxID=1162980 RepID=UPI0013C48C42|nr:protein phosphatase CheZ [Cohaesibacter haloalkalitolerans]
MPPSPLRQEDYLAIEAAVMETARGRWFLAEYARRNRNADTDTLLSAIDKLEKSITRERAPSSLMHQVRMDLADMAHAIERTKKEIAQIKHEDNEGAERFERATIELDAIVSQTESATSEILGAAEKIQEFAWTLREMGADSDKCDELDMEATNIYMACSFQDLTGQRIRKIVDAMRYIESRINSMIEIWGFESDGMEVDQHDHKRHDQRPDAHLLNGPALAGEGVGQDDVDMLFDNADLHEEADQDDVDALFANAGSATEDEDDSCDLSAEMTQDEADALFDTGPSVMDAEFEADEDEAMVADGAADGEDETEAEFATIEADAADEADDAVIAEQADVDFVDMQDLDWASEANATKDAADYLETVDPAEAEAADDLFDSVSNEVEPEGDVFASVSADEEAASEAEDQAGEHDLSAMMKDDADVFAPADVFGSALQDKAVAAEEEEEEEFLDLRDRVAQFS